jgi:hypothetical protein
MFCGIQDPERLFGGDEVKEINDQEGSEAEQELRELKEIHAIFDALGLKEGLAADRLVGWFRHKVTANRANGHQESCQCGICGEDRTIWRTFLRLRRPGGGA